MRPLRVTIRLAGPMMAPEHPIHLDGLLSALRVQEAEQAGEEEPWLLQHDIPVERFVPPSSQWVFKASILRGRPLSEPFLVSFGGGADVVRASEMAERGELEESQPSYGGGPFKQTFFALPAVHVDTLVGELVGDAEGVRRLLAGLSFVGARRSTAMGRVREVLVEEVGEALWTDRVLPLMLPEPPGTYRTLAALRAPYWRVGDMVPALAPLRAALG